MGRIWSRVCAALALASVVAAPACLDVGAESAEPGGGGGAGSGGATGGAGGGMDSGPKDGSQCWPGEKWCGVCVGATEPSHGCSGAGCEPCVVPNATAGCASEKCAVLSCAPFYSDCNKASSDGCEVNTQASHEACGGCGKACGATEVCLNGSCSSTCGTLTNCSGSCVDTASDEQHCGDCTTQCPALSVCNGGKCGCAAGLASCGGSCVDTKTSKQHCGTCNKSCTDPANGTAACSNGACLFACNPGFTLCGTQCVDTTSSSGHCGGCNKACEPNCTGAACPCKASQCVGIGGAWLATSMQCGGVEFLNTTATYYDLPNGQYKGVNTDNDCEETVTGAWATSPPNNYTYTATLRVCAPEGCTLGTSTKCVSGPATDVFNGKYSMSADGSLLTVAATGACAGGADYVGKFNRVP